MGDSKLGIPQLFSGGTFKYPNHANLNKRPERVGGIRRLKWENAHPNGISHADASPWWMGFVLDVTRGKRRKFYISSAHS